MKLQNEKLICSCVLPSLLMMFILLFIMVHAQISYGASDDVSADAEKLKKESLMHNRRSGELARQRKYDEAIVAARNALELSEKVYGKVHRDVAADVVTLANLYRAKGDYFNAERMLMRAKDIDTKIFGSNHPEVGVDILSIAYLYQIKDDYVTAEQNYITCIELFKNSLTNGVLTETGERMITDQYLPNLAMAHHQYGLLLLELRKYDKSLEQMHKAENIYELVDRSEAVKVLITMAEISRKLGDQLKADAYLRRAEVIKERR